MTIKNRGGVFGRNPTFNDVDVDGTLSVGGAAIPAPANIVTTSDVGTIASQDANSVNIDGGAIDGTTIGASSASTGKFTTVDVGANADIYSPLLNVRSAGVSLEWGHSNSAGYPCTMGAEIGSGSAYIAFNAGGGTTNNTYRTAGILGTVFRSDNIGNIRVERLTNSNADNQTGTLSCQFTSGGNIAFASGNGIDFSATAGTGTSELFDDYEEGTWTPVVEGTTTAGTATYVRQGGLYQKVGNVVHFVAAIVYNSHTGTGNMRVSGLPYTVWGGSDFHRIYLPFYADNLTITGVPVATAILGQTYLDLRSLNNGSSSLLAMDAAATLYITGKYWVA